MSTRSRIGFYDDEVGVVCSVYCHCDGYLEYNGKLLIEHYNSLEKARELVSLGDISSLGENLKPRSDFNPKGTRSYNHMDGSEVVVTRDYGISDYANSGFDCDEEYLYLYMFGSWYYMTPRSQIWLKVADDLAKMDDQIWLDIMQKWIPDDCTQMNWSCMDGVIALAICFRDGGVLEQAIYMGHSFYDVFSDSGYLQGLQDNLINHDYDDMFNEAELRALESVRQ